MRTAICTGNGDTYDAHHFAHLEPARLLELRSQLRCPGCGATAYFRKRTNDGKAPCFGSNNHQPDCPHHDTHSRDAEPKVPERLAAHPSLTITLIDPHDRAKPHEPHEGAPSQHAQRPTNSRPTRLSRGLRTILRAIVGEPELLYSDVIIHAPGLPQIPARDFFRRFEQIDPAIHINQARGYWGTVISTHTTAPPSRTAQPETHTPATQDLWLNSGPPQEPSVLIPAAWTTPVLAHAHRREPEDLIGSYVLVLGTCRRSAKGKLYIRPHQQHCVAFRDGD